MRDAQGGTMQRRIARELESLREQAQLRSLEIPGDTSGLNLCSNDYLGLASDPRLKEAVAESVGRAERVGSTGSRLLSGNAREWEELEAEFAAFAGTAAALYFGSGYAANIGLLSSLLKPGDTVFSDALNHASLIDGMRLSGASRTIYPHADLEFLERALRQANGAGARVIVTESVFSMEGDVAPLGELMALARKYDASLIVDEAHATGVWGPGGRGVMGELGLENETLGIVHTCGKALGSAGAFVCGSGALREHLINRARTFIFSTAMPAYFAGQIRAALSLARAADAERAHLRAIAGALREALAAAGLPCGTSCTQIVPVILGTNEAALHVASELQRGGFAVRAIRPPTVPPGTARIRISLTSKITIEDVRRLAAAILAAHKSPADSARSVVHA
ncbi:MAG TPA: 8-amino-7-oxononanoate synthase [Candidatus Acidoferrales bacterium]|nr:8-amino-7-oxononanoate synthase [Candidatus Acidoferrales bacterium]